MDTKTYTFHTFGDGQEVQATAHFDLQNKDGTKGIAILFHGGGFAIGSKDTVPESQISAPAELGFVTIAANYRLCPHVSLWDGPLADARNVYFWSRKKLPHLLQDDVGVTLNADKIVAIGYSAGSTLALHLVRAFIQAMTSPTEVHNKLTCNPRGTLSPPPRAIADFYGTKLFSDPFWFSPPPALSSLPDFSASLTSRIFEEPPATFTQSSMEKESADAAKEKRKGMPQPDFSNPRNAWLFDNLKKGTQLAACVQDGDYDRCDAVTAFGKTFPPTVFVHGTGDDLVGPRISEEAFKLLKEKGGVTELILAEDCAHGFDIGLEREEEGFDKRFKGKFMRFHLSRGLATDAY
ncbi:hypothetical protein GTA08_BOTSDO06246 [Botryosphaeria dothidea]|uniref:Alpha/beta hydrolase fold-3 domain-containing protein n=1 Tax=Botryosphaeria dothidea TaxID=55169 RepID=A0A8H4IJ47_9PEZI|nr:hypothetical protein GTA08_BOTSDO10252 [Botryosphaeria dothidea]KAF4305765.1 hypothetical protein GTA08_BOTSDO06246 [Botryosphaeria dothidea]